MNAITLDNQTKLTFNETKIYRLLEKATLSTNICELSRRLKKDYKSTWRMIRNLYKKGIVNLNPKPEYGKRGKQVLVSLWANETSEDFLLQFLSNFERKRGRISKEEYTRFLNIQHSSKDLLEKEKFNAAMYAEINGLIRQDFVLTDKGRNFIKRSKTKNIKRKIY